METINKGIVPASKGTNKTRLTEDQKYMIERAKQYDGDEPKDLAYKGYYILIMPNYLRNKSLYSIDVCKGAKSIFSAQKSSYLSALALAKQAANDDLAKEWLIAT